MDVRDTPVSEVMQPETMKLSPDDSLDFVEDIMNLGRVRHFPVVREGVLVGIVSQRDLLAASLTRVLEFEGSQRRAFLHSVTVGEVMTEKVRTVSPDTSLADVARLFARLKIGCAPVVNDQGELLGLVTESDLLAHAYLGGE